jgi:MFS family permease
MGDGPSDLETPRNFGHSANRVEGRRQAPRHRCRQHGGAAIGGVLRDRGPGARISRVRRRTASQLGFGVLRKRDVRRFLAAQLASISGDFIVIAALPFAVFALGGTGAQVGVAFGAGAFFEVLALLFGGAVGDRFQRRTVMIAADSLRFASQAVLALLLILGIAEFWQLLVVQVIQGVGAAFFNPAMNGFVPEVVSERRLQDANALLTAAFAAGTMLGPATAGVLMAVFGVGWAFALDAIIFAASALLLRSIRMPTAASRESSDSFLDDIRDGWKEFRKRTWLWVVVAEFGLLNALVFGPFQMLGASIAVDSLGGLGAWAVILTALGVGRLGGALVALFWRPQRPLFTAILLVGFWAVPLSLLATAAPLPAIAVATAIGGAALSVFTAIWHTTMQSRVPEHQLSRMFSYDWLGSLGLLPIGYLVAVGGQFLVSAEATLIAAACVAIAATAIVVPLPAIRGIRSSQRLRPAILTPATTKQAT